MVSLSYKQFAINGVDVDWSDIKNWACCTRDNPCTVGGGDCDGHYECEGNLKCGVNNCWRDFSGNGAYWDPTADCCYGKVERLTIFFFMIAFISLIIVDRFLKGSHTPWGHKGPIPKPSLFIWLCVG